MRTLAQRTDGRTQTRARSRTWTGAVLVVVVAATARWMGGGGGVDDDDDGATRSETRDATYTIRMCVRVCVCERACLAELFEADYVRVRHNGHVCVFLRRVEWECFLTLRTRVAASLV